MSAPAIAVFTKNRTNPAYAAARLGADLTARRMGARIVHYVPEKPDDAPEQIALIDEALTHKPDAVVIVPAHPTAVNAAIRRIHDARIPLFGLINRFTEPEVLTSFVTSDDYALGLDVALHACRHLDGRGDVVVVAGPCESVTSIERVRAFHDAVKSFPAMRVTATIHGEYQHEDTLCAGGALLKSGIRFDALLCANDVMALAMLEVLAGAGRSSMVTGINAVPAAIEQIKGGRMLATADFDAMKMACLATEAALRHLRGEPVPREILLPVEVVTIANCARWDLPFERRTPPRWDDVAAGASLAARPS